MTQKRYVIIDTIQGVSFETVLPLGIDEELAKSATRIKRAYITPTDRAVVELAIMDYDPETGIVDYSEYDTVEC